MIPMWLKRKIGPKISAPGATQEQIDSFLRRNLIIGGKVTVSLGASLDNMSSIFSVGGEIVLCGNVKVTGLSQFGSKIEIK